jgi:hypothetical protein
MSFAVVVSCLVIIETIWNKDLRDIKYIAWSLGVNLSLSDMSLEHSFATQSSVKEEENQIIGSCIYLQVGNLLISAPVPPT